MKLLNSMPPYNFGGVEPPAYGKCKIVVLPVPYDATASYKSGSRDGPHAIISASRNFEWFDEELLYEPAKLGIYTTDELQPETNSPEEMSDSVEKIISQILEDGKFPMMLGGEHSISAGAFAAMKKKFGEFTILQFDAHPDLRDEYGGSRYNHACVMRRGFDLGIKAVQVGIRSVCQEDFEFMEKNREGIRTFYAKGRDSWNLDEILNACSERVYITFDLDAFDSAIMPATGTPEPGGIDWGNAMKILDVVSEKRKIIGADVVELLPIPGLHACDFLAARLAYKIIAYSFRKEKV